MPWTFSRNRQPPIPEAEGGGGARTLLLVDDDPGGLETTEFILALEGYRVLTAATGEEALVALRRAHPPLVLMDVMMPGADGFEVCRRIRRDPALMDVHLIVWTARGHRADEKLAFDAGADEFFRKPLDAEALLVRLDLVYSRG